MLCFSKRPYCAVFFVAYLGSPDPVVKTGAFHSARYSPGVFPVMLLKARWNDLSQVYPHSAAISGIVLLVEIRRDFA